MFATLCSVVIATVLAQAPAAPGEPPAKETPGAAESALKDFQRDAKKYVLTLRTSTSPRLELAAEPLLHWGNPARTNEDGAVFIWTKDGRPEVIGGVFTYQENKTGKIARKHAFHSLSDQPLTAEYGDQLIWSPKEPGVRFAPVSTADPPAPDARRRLKQMRDMAREFSAQMIDFKGEKTELRLMTQPLIRYQPTAGPAVDGAIFSFAVGTDPEALLILEARQTDKSLRWVYGFARFHFITLVAQHAGQEVWRVEGDKDMSRAVFGNDPNQRDKIYYSVLTPR